MRIILCVGKLPISSIHGVKKQRNTQKNTISMFNNYTHQTMTSQPSGKIEMFV